MPNVGQQAARAARTPLSALHTAALQSAGLQPFGIAKKHDGQAAHLLKAWGGEWSGGQGDWKDRSARPHP